MTEATPAPRAAGRAQDPAGTSAPARSPGRPGVGRPAAVPLRFTAAPPPLPLVEGGFRTVLADPPWRFTNRTGKVAPEHRRLDRYSTLGLDQVCALDLTAATASTAHLYLWVPNALLPDGLRVMEAWGFCCATGTRILTADLRWVPAEQLTAGDAILAFDEERVPPGNRRYYRWGKVLSTGIEELECYEITLADGASLVCTGEHRWLMRTSNNGPERAMTWIRTDRLQHHMIQNGRREPLCLPRLMPVVPEDRSYEAGYLAAAFDGEGSIHARPGSTWGLTFSQNTNAMLAAVDAMLTQKGFPLRRYEYGHETPVTRLRGGRMATVRALMQFRPPRLIANWLAHDIGSHSLYNTIQVPIVSVTPVGRTEVVTLTTDTGTYIAEGFGAHNTYKSNIVWAKRRKDAGPDGRGVGFYFRNVTELLLFGVRGSMRTLAPGRRQVNMIESRKREHSRKPDEQYELIEACSPGPYLELFARHPRPGWTAWGDEAATEIAPRGQVHRGYQGGEFQVPYLDAHVRLPSRAADRIAGALRIAYEDGATIRELAGQTGYSIARVRSLLARAETSIRARGRSSPGQP